MSAFHVYDTTLRDGAQQEGLNLSVADKLTIAGFLDDLGVGYIEGGWPGANPKDTEFFRRAAAGELRLQNAVLAAFGSTRRANAVAADDPQVRALIDAQTPVVTIVAKSHIRHVHQALHTTADENLAMVQDTVETLVREGRRVFVDAEHFFDGYQLDKDFNRCMFCHARTKTEETGAIPVSITHYMDRDNNVLAEVSPRRYFCTQCHVPQADAKPLVGNSFVDVETMLRRAGGEKGAKGGNARAGTTSTK